MDEQKVLETLGEIETAAKRVSFWARIEGIAIGVFFSGLVGAVLLYVS